MDLYDCPDWAAIERRQDADRFDQMLCEQAESDAAQARMADEFKKLAAAGNAYAPARPARARASPGHVEPDGRQVRVDEHGELT